MEPELRTKLGALLKLERERLNIDLGDLAEQLKISEDNLHSIEQGSVEGLPSEIYFGLFAKSYAEAIGIDYLGTVDAMKAEIMPVVEPEETQKKKQAPKKAKPKKKKKKLVSDDDEIVDEEVTEEEEQEEDAGVGHLKRLGILVGAIAGVLILFVVVYEIFWSGDGAPGSASIFDSPDEVAEGQAADESARFANYDWEVSDFEKPEPLVLKLRAREPSWATVLADGDTVIFRGLGAGREYVIRANYRIRVSIALPQFVETELNGKIVNLRDPESRRISRVVIDQLNVDNYLNPETAEEERPNPSPPPRQRSQPTETSTDVQETAKPLGTFNKDTASTTAEVPETPKIETSPKPTGLAQPSADTTEQQVTTSDDESD